jgi:hypothetical protein
MGKKETIHTSIRTPLAPQKGSKTTLDQIEDIGYLL